MSSSLRSPPSVAPDTSDKRLITRNGTDRPRRPNSFTVTVIFFQVKSFFQISKEVGGRWVIILYVEIYFTESDTYRDSIWIKDQQNDSSIWVFEVHVAWYECRKHTMTWHDERDINDGT